MHNEKYTTFNASSIDNRRLLEEEQVAVELHEVILPAKIQEEILLYKKEYAYKDKLLEHGLTFRNRILLAGPPGNGKTMLAKALSSELKLPFVKIRYDAVINSHLGESEKNIMHIKQCLQNYDPCIVFFDEFDMIARSRSQSEQDVAEMRRMTNTLLIMMDEWPQNIIFIAATNLKNSLDKAVLRRFNLTLELENGTKTDVMRYIEMACNKHDVKDIDCLQLAKKWHGQSYAAIENNILTAIRQWILNDKAGTVMDYIR